MFVFDIETVGVESTAGILSAGIVYFEVGSTYQDMLDNSLFVKFDITEQMKQLKRSQTKSTMEWWKEQPLSARQMSLIPDPSRDVSAADGIQKLKNFIGRYDDWKKRTFWARGSLDQPAIDSLCRAVGVEPLTQYSRWRDVRTAIDFLSPKSNFGYCKINHDSFDNKSLHAMKHDPVIDCIIDAGMILYPEE